MEPVVLPKFVSSVTRSERVKRTRSREHSDRGSGFEQYWPQKKIHPPDDRADASEEPDPTPDPVHPENAAEQDSRTAPKLIDIRV
jgi:hypothetical protein